MNPYTIKEGPHHMDFDKVTQMLSKAYWSVGIKKEEVLQGAQHSTIVFGVFDKEDKQIGYARILSDKTRFCYLMDVMVDEALRGQGIGQLIIKHILSHPELKDVYTWTLRTEDAHTLYEKFGFKPIEKPGDWMIISKPRKNG